MEAAGEVLHGEGYFPAVLPTGGSRAQVLSSSPSGGSEDVRLMYLLSIAGARRNVRLAASYFVPDDLALRTLVEARRRGVTIEVIVPGPEIDAEVVRRASRARWGPLLKAGVRIHEYQPTMFHCKVMIVDDQWVSVGSTNFDDRSFRLNDETNLNVLDPRLRSHPDRGLRAGQGAQPRDHAPGLGGPALDGEALGAGRCPAPLPALASQRAGTQRQQLFPVGLNTYPSGQPGQRTIEQSTE
jgi:cardiolipin synthase